MRYFKIFQIRLFVVDNFEIRAREDRDCHRVV